jgi:hypothetical protein
LFYKLLSVLIFFCFLFNNSALSEKWNINIEGYLSGFKVGESNISFEINNDKYTLIAKSNTSGITKFFYPWKQIIEAAGSINNFIIKPLIYKIKDIREDKETGFINIRYQNNYPIVESAFPDPSSDNRRKQVPRELIRNTLDPVNSILALGLLSANNNSCNHTINVFDGRRRFNLEYRKIEQNKDELICKLKIIRIAGYSNKELSKHPKEGTVTLKKLSNNINFYFPIEVKIPLTIGSFYVDLTQKLVLQ